MKTFLTSAAAIILGLAAQAMAVAGDGHGRSGQQNGHATNNGQVHVSNQGNGQSIQNINHKTTITPIQGNMNGNKPSYQNQKGTGQYAKNFKDYKGPCYYGKGNRFWSRSCWNSSYGCETYWCNSCWFYWCQPYGCYLPVDYCPTGCYAFQQ